MAVLTEKQANSTTVQLAQFKTQVESYFAAAKSQIFRGFAYTPGQAQIASNAASREADFRQKLTTLETMIRSRSYQGRALTSEDVSSLLAGINGDLEGYQAQVKAWNESSPLPVIFETVSTMFMTARDTLLAIQKGFGGAVQTFAKWLPYVPWIIAGAFLLPSVLRIIAKKRREGADAALEYTAGEIEAGRASAGRAAAGAGRAAITAAKFAI